MTSHTSTRRTQRLVESVTSASRRPHMAPRSVADELDLAESRSRPSMALGSSPRDTAPRSRSRSRASMRPQSGSRLVTERSSSATTSRPTTKAHVQKEAPRSAGEGPPRRAEVDGRSTTPIQAPPPAAAGSTPSRGSWDGGVETGCAKASMSPRSTRDARADDDMGAGGPGRRGTPLPPADPDRHPLLQSPTPPARTACSACTGRRRRAMGRTTPSLRVLAATRHREAGDQWYFPRLYFIRLYFSARLYF